MVSSNYKLFDNLIWLNSNEAAEYLRITPGALRAKVYRGEIKPYKLGRSSRFKRSELDKLLEISLKKEFRHGN